MKLTPEDIRIMRELRLGVYIYDNRDSAALQRLNAVAYTIWDEEKKRLALTALGDKALGKAK